MAESRLGEELAEERSQAVRILLATPLLDSDDDPDAFRLVVRHAEWLVGYFEQTCGWWLVVDPASGFARLAKRSAGAPDTSRPLRRTRGDRVAFDRRRYELLCVFCAELVRHPVTTVGLLASAVGVGGGLDSSRYAERTAFVDALRALVQWGVIRVSVGDLDAYIDDERANAILSADTARLHRLIVGGVAPSTLPDDLATSSVVRALQSEPRYGEAAIAGGEASEEARHRWARHHLGRRLLDDPVVHLDDLTDVERDYLATISGRRWVRDRVAEAGFELEERREGLLAVDPDRIATDVDFPAPRGNAFQLALLLADRMMREGPTGERRLCRLDARELREVVEETLARFPRWARVARESDGAERLTRQAVELLTGFGLVRREPDGTVAALPALARYRVGAPVVLGDPTLFEEVS